MFKREGFCKTIDDSFEIEFSLDGTDYYAKGDYEISYSVRSEYYGPGDYDNDCEINVDDISIKKLKVMVPAEDYRESTCSDVMLKKITRKLEDDAYSKRKWTAEELSA